MTQFHDAVRQQQSLLAPLERRCLVWLAERTPAGVNSDHLTVLGLVAVLLGGICYASARWWPPALLAVNLCLALNWFGDSLDGTLARVRGRLRPRYGFYVDHMVDAAGSLFLLVGLAVSGYMSERVAVAMLITFLLLAINTYLATYTIGTFQLSFWKFSPTEMRILLAAGNTVTFFRPVVRVFGGPHLFLDVAGTIATAAMVVVLLVSVARNILTLYRAERIPEAESVPRPESIAGGRVPRMPCEVER